jgi:hypothetical protein
MDTQTINTMPRIGDMAPDVEAALTTGDWRFFEYTTSTN